jgi:hypothetical protein
MALQHLRSSTADKRPTPAAMSDGQLALNTNLASPGLFFKDSNGDSVKIGPVHIGTTAPNATPGAGGQAGNSKGEAWLDTTAANPILKVFNGSAFVAVQPVGTGTVVSTTDTGTVTSTMILDGTILNADINASAAIVDTKLATIATGGKVSGTAITSGNISTSGSFTSTSTVTGTNLIPTGSGVPTNGIYLPAANSVAVATNGTGRLFVDSSGNVGINTASTIAPGGFGYAREFALTGATSGDSSISVNLRGSRTVPGGFADINFWHQSTANRAYIQARRGSSDSAIDLDFITSGGAGMRITSAGLVGVGTSSPGRSLEVFGSASSFARFNATGLLANGLDVGYSSAGYALINNQENTSLAFATNNTERLRITSAGLVGIGNSAPSKTLDVVGDAKIVKTASTQNILLGVSSGAIGYKTQIDFGHPTVGARIESERLGANTQSSLSFWTTSAAGATGRALTIDASQRVGIGTASPSAPLCVQGAANSDQLIVTGLNGLSRGLKISTGADYANDSLVKYDAQYASGSNYGAHAFLTGGQERLRLDRLGRVGIGVTSAQDLLHLNTASAGTALRLSNGSNLARLLLATNTTSSIASNNSNLDLNATEAYNLTFTTNGSERARIDSSGRLLVGTSSNRTGYNLQLEGSTGADAGASFIRNETSNSGGSITLGKSGGTTDGSFAIVANNDALGTIAFTGADGTADKSGARIQAFVDGTPGANDMPGRLVFSTTSDGASSPTERMRIRNTGTIYARGTGSVFSFASNVGAGISDWLQLGGHSATGILTYTISYAVYTNGNVVNTNGSYTAISDAKLKENIVDAGSQWNDLKAIQIRNWNFKAETGHETHRQIGPIAQELETVCPGLVFETPDRDEDGNETGEVTKGVNQSVLYMKAVKALQEAMERIEQLETEMAAVKAQLS